MKKFLLYTTLILITLFLLGIIFSPFCKNERNGFTMVDVGIEIYVPIDTLYHYLGNSENAKIWSSYVDHIDCLNPEEFNDGDIGSIRRCFQHSDNTGHIWDEKIIDKKQPTMRKLSIYNPQNFDAWVENLETTQTYFAVNDSTTQLHFSLYFKDNNYSMWESVKMSFAAYKIKSIFVENLENIKKDVEQP